MSRPTSRRIGSRSSSPPHNVCRPISSRCVVPPLRWQTRKTLPTKRQRKQSISRCILPGIRECFARSDGRHVTSPTEAEALSGSRVKFSLDLGVIGSRRQTGFSGSSFSKSIKHLGFGSFQWSRSLRSLVGYGRQRPARICPLVRFQRLFGRAPRGNRYFFPICPFLPVRFVL